MEEPCLLLIVLQNDYSPGGKMLLDGIEEAAVNSQRVLKRFREMELPVIHVRHTSIRPGANFLVPDTRGSVRPGCGPSKERACYR